MTIREANIGDIPMLQNLAEQFYMPAYAEIHTEEQNRYSLKEMYSTESLERQFKELKSRYFILEDEGQDRGYAAIYPMGDGQWMLDKIYLAPRSKSRGYGRALFEHIKAVIGKQEVSSFVIRLHVNRRNEAVAFYRHLGFEIEEEWDIAIADGKWIMDGYTMMCRF